MGLFSHKSGNMLMLCNTLCDYRNMQAHVLRTTNLFLYKIGAISQGHKISKIIWKIRIWVKICDGLLEYTVSDCSRFLTL